MTGQARPDPTPSVVLVSSAVRPHEVLFLLASAILGGLYAIGGPPATSVAAHEPAWLVSIWSAGLFVSGVLGLYAVLWFRSDPVRKLRFEGASMTIGAGALIMYATTILTFAGWRGVGSLLTVGLWAMANLWRGRQIQRQLGEVWPR